MIYLFIYLFICIVLLHRCAVICWGVLLFKPDGLCEGERAVFEGAGMQHKVSNYEAMRGRERDQLQYGDWNGGEGWMSPCLGCFKAEPFI